MSTFNIDDLTLGQIKEIQALIGNQPVASTNTSDVADDLLGKSVIVRTYSAGVWFGELSKKSKNEIILSNARRMWKWWAKKGISLSACALYGVKHEESKIIEPVDAVWLEAIEIIPCSETAIRSIAEAPHVDAE